ncbi:facilitated trehalose transporter Tret1-like [Epargyreus clarus]|uniref:facilitated trehalose transporter Tret1-like n=1 Tax=Epargyreus clarus TaxID=520877 RepID=UPI003C30298A
MALCSNYATPFMKQCFVTFGVTLKMAGHGAAVGFTAVLLPQLRKSNSAINIDDSTGSWIASILSFAFIIGNFTSSILMGIYGRKIANLVSIVPMIIGWVCIVFATNMPFLLTARVLQGLSIGMGVTLGPVLISEYSSPKYRGAFLMSISVKIAIGVLTVHTLGSYLKWQTTAVIYAVITVVDFIIVACSPESPSWLADHGKYEESKRVFRWLRGSDEECELERMIEASKAVRESRSSNKLNRSLQSKMEEYFTNFFKILRKKEFYKPIFIMAHVYTISQWGGVNLFAAYAVDVFNNIIGDDFDIPLLIISVDAQRIISNALAVYIITKIRRRTLLSTTVGIGIFAFLSIATYSYLREMKIFNNSIVAIILIHIHMFSIAAGTLPFCYIISGELFPLEYRSFASAISVIFHSMNFFIMVKTVPFLFNTIGLHGTYCVYAGIIAYCLVVLFIFLPETKDRTLQEIEEEFKGLSGGLGVSRGKADESTSFI